MNTDMSQFYQVFFEETDEHLNEMERLLLGLDIAAPNQEDLNAIFRAAHSIKGNSATFGFTDLTEVTHLLESLLDKIRKHERRLQSEMVDTFLDAVDVLRRQLDGHRNGAEVDPGAAAGVCARLKELAQEAPPPTRKLVIEFAPKEPAAIEKNLESLSTDLGRLGKLEVEESEEEGKRKWKFFLATEAKEEAISDIFSFFANADEIKISPEPVDEGYGFFEPLPEQPDQGYGFFQEVAQQPETQPEKPPEEEAKFGRRVSDRLPGAESASIRVSVEKVDQLINMVGELVITQAMLAQTASALDPVLHENLSNGLAQLERNTRDLQESVMSIRMLPISFVFSRFPRLIRDLAAKLSKEAELVTIGESTELDKGLIEKITDPLTHLVRNSLDHGIEPPEKRIALGKPARGTVTLEASHQGGNIVISVSDDGAGLDREKILAKAMEKHMDVHESMSDADVWQLIFAPGFSTAEVVTDVSGRGVGMDVVKKNILALNGQVEIDSALGVGSRFTIRLPLTLAILDGMSISVGGQIFIVPLAFIIESMQPGHEEVKTVEGSGKVVHVRGEYLPLVALHQIFGIETKITEADQGIVVLIEAEGKRAAMLVDELVGQHQVVIKALETNYRKVEGISAATIMGDGRVALILDMAALVRISQR